MKKLFKKYKKTTIFSVVLLGFIISFIIGFFEPKTKYIEYWNQELLMQENIKITNTFKSSHEICSYGTTKIIIDGKEEILLDFPHSKDLYIKGCAIDIEYINKNTVQFPICYAGGAGSGECSLIFMTYNIKTKKWLYKTTKEFYTGEETFPLFLKIWIPILKILHAFSFETEDGKVDYSYPLGMLKGKSVNEIFQEKYFDLHLFKFVNYFNVNSNLENFDDFNQIYKSKVNLLSKTEKKVILNTIYYHHGRKNEYLTSYEAINKKIISYFDKKLTDKDKKDLAKFQYISKLDFYKINNEEYKYDEILGVDDTINKLFKDVSK
ncbi:hypothetical protein A9Q91_04190 [Candidatus Gracilibacteria bacterium 28_42_T64]|nr:hypothetical protein A9Q91_04190 [Candidatus Gracilibacteria bacterium 28_42_T64]